MKKRTLIIFYAINAIIFIPSFIAARDTRNFSFAPIILTLISFGLILYFTLFLLTKSKVSYTYIPFIVGVGLVAFAYIFMFPDVKGFLLFFTGLIGAGLGYLGAIVMIIYHLIRRFINKQSEEKKF